MPKTINNIRKISIIPKSCRERYLPSWGRAGEILHRRGINFSGISELCRGYEIGYPDLSERHMVIFTKAGLGYLKTPYEEYSLTPGTVIVVPPGNRCGFGICGDCWDILWMYMLDIPVLKPLKNKGISLFDTVMIPRLEMAMEGYLRETQAGSGDESAAEICAELIICYFDRTFDLRDEPHRDETLKRLDKLWQHVVNNPSEDWSNRRLAKMMHVSPSTLSRVVLKYFGVTPRQKVIQIRMEQAALLLRKTDYSLQLVAERLGYANEFVFSAAFKKYASVSPRAFRRNG